MNVHLKCFSTLADADACDYREAVSYDISDGATVAELLRAADISPQNVKLVFVNGKAAGIDTALDDGDRVGLAPAVGGM
jgi:sulfur carrier protein ThiS